MASEANVLNGMIYSRAPEVHMHVNLCHKIPCVVELSPAVRLVSIGRVKVGHRVGSMREYSLLVWLWASSALWYCKILVHYSVVCYQRCSWVLWFQLPSDH